MLREVTVKWIIQSPTEKRCAWNWQEQTLGIFHSYLVREAKRSVERLLGVPRWLQLLSLNGQQLSDDTADILVSSHVEGERACLVLTDFSALRSLQGKEIVRIPFTERRGISLQQLKTLGLFFHVRADLDGIIQGWFDHFSGEQIIAEFINLYHVNDWVLKPATSAQKCSYVEFVASSPDGQSPLWFISHAWCEPIVKFTACVAEHCRLRHLAEQTPFWVCAYCNNQHELHAELVRNPRETSFFRAMRACVGVLLVLDEKATPFQRMWCCFEASVVLTHDDEVQRMLFDVVTTLGDHAHVLTDGVVEEDVQNRRMKHDEWRVKGERESTFPIELVLNSALNVKIESAEVSVDADKRRILNSIAGMPEACLDDEPPSSHEAYDRVNRSLHAMFAITVWRQCVPRTHRDELRRIAQALWADTERKSLCLNFSNMFEFDDRNLEELARALPLSLQSLTLDLQDTKVSDRGVAALAAALAANAHLQALELTITGCAQVGNPGLSAIAACLPELETLELNAMDCEKIGDNGLTALSKARFKRLSRLSLNFWHCKISDEGLASLGECLTSSPVRSLNLNLEGCTSIGDPGVAALASGLPGTLVTLSVRLHGCRKFTDRGVDALSALMSAELLPHLESISIHVELTSATVTAEKACGLLASLRSWVPCSDEPVVPAQPAQEVARHVSLPNLVQDVFGLSSAPHSDGVADESNSEEELEQEPCFLLRARRGGLIVIWSDVPVLQRERSCAKMPHWGKCLRASLEACPLFAGMDRVSSWDALIDAMSFVCVDVGEQILRKGDAGNSLFVVISGSVECDDEHGVTPPGQGRFFKSGDTFGELAMLLNEPHAWSAHAMEFCEIGKLTREAYQEHVVRSELNRRFRCEELLRNLELLSAASGEQIASLADVCWVRSFEQGEEVLAQNQAVDSLVVVLSGECRAIDGEHWFAMEEIEHQKLMPGQVCGEQAFLEQTTHVTSVIACVQTEVLVVQRRKLERMLGPLQNLWRPPTGGAATSPRSKQPSLGLGKQSACQQVVPKGPPRLPLLRLQSQSRPQADDVNGSLPVLRSGARESTISPLHKRVRARTEGPKSSRLGRRSLEVGQPTPRHGDAATAQQPLQRTSVDTTMLRTGVVRRTRTLTPINQEQCAK